MKKVRAEIAAFLKTKRTSAGVSQKLVAEKLGHSTPQFISNWEKGLSFPPVKDIKTIAKLYKFSADELFEMVLTARVQNTKKELLKEFQGSR